MLNFSSVFAYLQVLFLHHRVIKKLIVKMASLSDLVRLLILNPTFCPFCPIQSSMCVGISLVNQVTYSGNGLNQSTINGDWYINISIDTSAVDASWYTTVVKDSLISFYDFDISSPALACFNPDVDGAFDISDYTDGRLHASMPLTTYKIYFYGKINHLVRDTLLMVSDIEKEKELLIFSGVPQLLRGILSI